MFVVFDLDGTIADTEHRAHFLRTPGKARDWRGFYAACDQDTPHIHIIQVLEALIFAGHDVEIWSGRSDEVRYKTDTWLRENGLDHVPIKMRAEGDFTDDTVLKKSWLESSPKRPDLIFDDRAKVVNMWREEGIPCCQVAPGDF